MTTQTSNSNVLLIRGYAQNGTDEGHAYEIYDDKADQWYPYLNINDVTNKWPHTDIFGIVGTRIYSINAWDKVDNVNIDAFDVTTQTTSTVTNMPMPVGAVIMDEFIYFEDCNRNIIRFNTENNKWEIVGEFYSDGLEHAEKTVIPNLVLIDGIIYRLVVTSFQAFNTATREVEILEKFWKFPQFFIAVGCKGRIYVVPLYYEYPIGDLLIYNPDDYRWSFVKPKCLSPVNNSECIVVHDGKLLSFGRFSVAHVYDSERNEWDYFCRDYNGIITDFRTAVSIRREILKSFIE